MSYKYNKPNRSLIDFKYDRKIGESIEQKCERMISDKEPISDAAPEIYTDRKDGVIGAYNIRTDRFEVAAEAMDSAHRSSIAKRDGTLEIVKDDDDGGGKDDGGKGDGDGVAKSLDGTN